MSDNNVLLAAETIKREIRDAVRASLDKFEQQTGVTPSHITVRMLDVSTMQGRRYEVAFVELEFKL